MKRQIIFLFFLFIQGTLPVCAQDLPVNGNLQLNGHRSIMFTQGDLLSTHRGGIHFLTFDNGTNFIFQPTNASGTAVNSTLRVGGFGAFFGNTVNLGVSGNVGIGTSSPTARLEIESNSTLLRLRGSAYVGSTPFDIVNLGLAGGSGAMNLAFRIGYPHLNGVNDGPKLDALKILNGNTVLNTDENGGNLGKLGVGFSNPNEKLAVNGNIHIPLHTSFGHLPSEDKFLYGSYQVGNYSLGWYNDPWIYGAPSGYLSAHGGLKVFTNSKAQFVVTHGGNVGIGTTSPDQKLTVDGTVRCEEVKVELLTGTGPDYVFEPDYDLKPLSEVEAYIRANKHLPEVPSAKAMEADGMNIKEMNLILLKKVEELTLHLIEMEKENKEQQKMINDQQQQITKLALKVNKN